MQTAATGLLFRSDLHEARAMQPVVVVGWRDLLDFHSLESNVVLLAHRPVSLRGILLLVSADEKHGLLRVLHVVLPFRLDFLTSVLRLQECDP